jgi:hypothetical protein
MGDAPHSSERVRALTTKKTQQMTAAAYSSSSPPKPEDALLAP